MYIDKNDPHNAILTLYAGDKSLILQENECNGQTALISIISNETQVDIYSGAERYIEKMPLAAKNISISSEVTLKMENTCWIVRDSFNVFTIDKKCNPIPYPFMALPMESEIEFIAPEVLD